MNVQELLRSQRTATIEIDLDLPILTIEQRNELKPPFAINVPYSEIKMLDTRRFLSRIPIKIDEHSYLKNRIMIKFYGYPNENGKSESDYALIRKWVQKLYNEVPHLFYYLSDFNNSLQKIFLCLADVPEYMVRNNNIHRFYLEENRIIANEIYNNAIAFNKSVHNERDLELEQVLKKALSSFITD